MGYYPSCSKLIEEIMKKVVIVLIAAFVCFESFAQETLKGRWSTSGKAMGMTITQTLVFDAEQSGSVERILTLTFAMNVLGVKADGEMEMSTMGTFEYKDGQLFCHWDPESLQMVTTKPIVCISNGEPVPEVNEEFEKAMTESMANAKESFLEEQVFDTVKLKKGKLTLGTTDENGKKQRETYSFVNQIIN